LTKYSNEQKAPHKPQQPPKSKSRKISNTTPTKKQVVIPHLMRNL